MNKWIMGLMASAAIALPAMAQTSPPGPQTERTQPPGTATQGEIAPGQLSRDQVMQLQQALKAKGHDVAVDGVWGPSTANALRGFQTKEGMSGSGLDSQTLTALGIDSARFGNPSPDTRVAPGAPPSTSPSDPGSPPGTQPNPGAQPDPSPGSPDRTPGAAPQQPNPGSTPQSPSGPSR